MAENKKIIFEGIDQGVASMYSKIAKQAKEMNLSMMDDARKQSNSAKEQIKFMEETLKQLEQQNKLYKEQQKTLLELSRTRELSGANRPAAIDRINEKYDNAVSNLTQDSRESSLISSALRELLEASKEQLRAEEARRREERGNNEREDDVRTERLFERRGKGSKDCIEICKDGGKGSGCCEECAQNGGGNGGPGGNGNGAGGAGGAGGNAGSTFRGTLAGNLAAEAIKNLLGSLGKTVSSLVGSKDETTFIGEAYTGIANIATLGQAPGLAAGVGAAKSREEQAQKDKQIASLRAKMMTGNSVGAMTGLGLTTAEANEFAKQIASAAGRGNNLSQKVNQLTRLKYGFGVNDENLLGGESIGRMTGTGGAQNIANLVSELKRQGIIKGGDYSQLNELLQTQGSLLREMGQNQISPDSRVAASLVSQFSAIGGAFGGERAGSRLAAINQSLINPGNEFAQAQNFATLASLNPQGSYFDLLKMQEKGISQEGFLSGRLKGIQNQVGSGTQDMALLAMNAFGLNAQDAELLVQAYKSGMIDDKTTFKTDEDMNKFLGKRKEEAGTGVAVYEYQQAFIEESFSKSFVEGVGAALKVAGKKLGTELVSDFKKAFSDGAKEELKDPITYDK